METAPIERGAGYFTQRFIEAIPHGISGSIVTASRFPRSSGQAD
jgi:hypothetical protein